MDDDSDWGVSSGIHHPRFGYGHHRSPDYGVGRPHPFYTPSSWRREPWTPDGNGHQYSRSSSRSTFEEVESLCLSKSSNDSFGQFHSAQRHGVRTSHPPPVHGHARGQVPGGRFLSRQSSTTSTSTSSGNVAEQLEKQSASTSTSGSVHEDAMETLDPRQQFDLQDHALLDGIFRRVLEWNNTHAAMGMARGGAGGVPFPQVPPTGYAQGFYPQGYEPPLHPPSPHAAHSTHPYMRPMPGGGQRVADVNKDKNLSPSSDITHVKKRRDLILPDEEEDVSFVRPHCSKSDSSPRLAGKTPSGSSGGTSSLSSKMASSDSWLSSSSSMSQSQDLSWREHYGHREARPPAWREPYTPGWGDPYVDQWKGTDPYHPGWRDQPPPHSGPPPVMMMPPGYAFPSSSMSRGLSLESMNSFGMASPPASFAQAQHMAPHGHNTAEVMLMNLGFGGSSEGFLPERFLKDWYNKLSRAQSQAAANQSAAVNSANNSPHGSFSSFHHQTQDSTVPLHSKPSYEDLRSASDLHRRITGHLSRAATISTSPSHDPLEPSAVRLPSSLGSQSRTDRLKEYIEAHAHDMGNLPDPRSQRIHQFASSRQKSLPSYLETLTEEDETRSRGRGHRSQGNQSHQHAFLREDSFSGKSESLNTSSGCTSNSTSQMGSESESQSGSDYHEFSQRKGQSLLTSRGQPVHGMPQEPSPVTHRSSLDVEHDQLQTSEVASDTVDGTLSAKKRHKHEQRSRHSSPKHRAESPQHAPSANLDIHSNIPTEGHHRDCPTSRSKSPKKERRAKSPCASKSPSHRARSPRQHRGRSPCKELKGKTTGDDVLRAKAPKSSFDDSSSSSSPHRKKSPSAANTKQSIAEIQTEIPKRNHDISSARQLSVGKNSDYTVESDINQDYRRQSEYLPRSAVNEKNRESSDNVTQKQENGDNAETERPEPLVSTESLEVADIFQNKHGNNMASHCIGSLPANTNGVIGKGQGELEPAMISIILQDVDGNLTESGLNPDASKSEPHVHGSDESQPHEDHLPLPSCSSSSSSSLSVSPIPMSPVTVIEVCLDNQQDSIDTEEGTSSSRDFNDLDDMSCMDSDTMQTLTDILSEDTDPGDLPLMANFGTDLCISPSLPSLQSPSSSSRDVSRQTCDVSVEADDGNTSPLLMLNGVSPMTSSSSSSPSVVGQPSNLSDVGIQSDDGRLTPLVLFEHDKSMAALIQNGSSEDLYLVSDQAVQCDGEVLIQDIQRYPTCGGDISEAPLLEMAHKVTQTSRLVKYEMSSQTETNAHRSWTYLESNTQTEQNIDSDFNWNVNVESQTEHIECIKGRNCLTAPHGMHSPVSPPPLPRHSSRCPRNLSRSLSQESEFWDYLGMEIPTKLQATPLSLELTDKQRTSCASYGFMLDSSATCQQGMCLSSRTHTSHLACACASLPDRLDTVQYSCHGNNILSSPENSPGFLKESNSHGICSPTESTNVGQRESTNRNYTFGTVHSTPEKYSVSDSTYLQTFSGVDTSQRHSTVPSESVKYRSANTRSTVPSVNSDNINDFPQPEHLHNSFMKPVMLNQPMLDHCQSQDGDSGTQVHVSVLSFNVQDYRDQKRPPSLDTPWSAGTNSDKHSGADKIRRKELSLERNPSISHSHAQYKEVSKNESCDTPATIPGGVIPQSVLSGLVDVNQQSAQMLTNKPEGLYECHDEYTLNTRPNLMASQNSLFDGAQQSASQSSSNKDPNSDFEAKRDMDFISKEEAKTVVMRQLLLRGSVEDSDSELSSSSPQTMTRAKEITEDDVSALACEEADRTEDTHFVRNGSDDVKSDVLALFLLRAPAVSPLMPGESSGCVDDTSHEGDRERHELQDTATMEEGTVERTVITAPEWTVDTPDIYPSTEDENKTDSEKAVENRSCRRSSNVNVEDTQYVSREEDIPVFTGKKSQALADRQSWLLETFAHSVIESACHELQKNYLKNKQKLRERLQGELKLTGVFETRPKPEDITLMDQAVTMETEATLNAGASERHTNNPENLETGDSDSPCDEGKSYSNRSVRNVSSVEPDSDSLQPHTDPVSDFYALSTIVDNSSQGVTDLCSEYDMQVPINYNQNVEDRHVQVQILVETEDDIVSEESNHPTSIRHSSQLQVESSEINLSLSRCLSAESFNSLRVNFSESAEDLSDVLEEDDHSEFSQGRLSDSDDDIQELPVFESVISTSPQKDRGESDTIVTDTTQSENCYGSCEDNVNEHGLSEDSTEQREMGLERESPLNYILTPSSDTRDGRTSVDCHCESQGDAGSHQQFVSSGADCLDFAAQENWFSSTIDLEGSEDMSDESSNMYEINENHFETLMFLGNDIPQNAYTGLGVVGYLPKIAEEAENLDQSGEQPDNAGILMGGMCGTRLTHSQSLPETQSSGKSSVEGSSEEGEFGMEVSLQPLPAEFAPSAVITDSFSDRVVSTKPDAHLDAGKEGGGGCFDKSHVHRIEVLNNNIGSFYPVFANDFKSVGGFSSCASFWRDENREQKSPDLFTKSEKSLIDNELQQQNHTPMETKDRSEIDAMVARHILNGNDVNDHEVARIVLNEMVLDAGLRTSVSPSAVQVLEQCVEDDSYSENSFRSYSTVQTVINPSLDDLKIQNTDIYETKFVGKRQAPDKAMSDRNDPMSSFSDDSASPTGPKLVSRFQRSISRESNTSAQSPERTCRVMSVPSPDSSKGSESCSTSFLHVPHVSERLVSKNSLLRHGSSSSESESPQPRSHSPVPSEWQLPVHDQSLSHEGQSFRLQPVASPKSLSPVSSVVLCSESTPVELLSDASPYDSPSVGTSPLPETQLSNIDFTTYDIEVPNANPSTPEFHLSTSLVLNSDRPVSNGHSPVADSPVSNDHFPTADSPLCNDHVTTADSPLSSDRWPALDSPVSHDHSPIPDHPASNSHSSNPDSPVPHSHPPDQRRVLLVSQTVLNTRASISNHSNVSDSTSCSENASTLVSTADVSDVRQSQELMPSPESKDSEKTSENTPLQEQALLSRSGNDQHHVSPETLKASKLPAELPQSESPSKSKPSLLPRRPPKILTPSRTMSSSGDESVPLQFTLSRFYYSSEFTPVNPSMKSEAEKQESSSDSPIPSTPSLSRDHSSTSDSSSSVKDTQLTSLQRLQGATGVPEKSTCAQDSLGTQLLVTGSPFSNVQDSVGKHFVVIGSPSRGVHESKRTRTSATGSPSSDVQDLLRVHGVTAGRQEVEIPSTDQDTSNDMDHAVMSQTSSSFQSNPCILPATSRVSSKPKAVAPAHLRRSRFQNMSNTMSALEKSSSSEHSSTENGATPKRRFFWSTDQSTVVGPDQGGDKSESSPFRLRTTEDCQRRPSRSSDISSLSEDSGNRVADGTAKPPVRRPRSLRTAGSSEDRGDKRSSSSSMLSHSRDGVSSDTERLAFNRQLRISPVDKETKSDSEVAVSSHFDHTTMNGESRKSEKSVRELARLFENKGKE